MNNRNSLLILLVALFIAFPASLKALAPEMPGEISNISIGMPLEELLTARPKILKPRKMDPDKLKTATMMLMEKFDGTGDFFSATYGIKDGKLFTITLLAPTPARGREGSIRRKVMKECIGRWGKNFVRRAPEDTKRPGKAKAIVTWLFDDVEAIVTLPNNREDGDSKPNYFSVQFRPRSSIEKHPWKDMAMSPSEKKALFKSNDIDE